MNSPHGVRYRSNAVVNAQWHTSSYSGSNGACVEHAPLPTGHQAVRDTKDRPRAVLLFAPAAWQSFVSSAGVAG